MYRQSSFKPKLLEDLAGTYTRYPTESEWHKVTVTPDGYNTAVWRNEADVSWNIQQDARDRKTLTLGEDCPYFEESNTMNIIRSDMGKVLGLVHKDEMYKKDSIDIVGKFRRNPIENDWHKVSITREGEEEYRWTTDNGNVSWVLRKDNDTINEEGGCIFRLDDDCPYFEDGICEVSLEIIEDEKVRLRFMDDVFTMDGEMDGEIDYDEDSEPEIDLSGGI